MTNTLCIRGSIINSRQEFLDFCKKNIPKQYNLYMKSLSKHDKKSDSDDFVDKYFEYFDLQPINKKDHNILYIYTWPHYSKLSCEKFVVGIDINDFLEHADQNSVITADDLRSDLLSDLRSDSDKILEKIGPIKTIFIPNNCGCKKCDPNSPKFAPIYHITY